MQNLLERINIHETTLKRNTFYKNMHMFRKKTRMKIRVEEKNSDKRKLLWKESDEQI